MKTTHFKRAFTIIELMVVVFIIGVLATIVIVTLERGKVKSRDAKRKADLALISSAFERYHVDMKKYPTSSLASVYCNLGVAGCLQEASFAGYLYPIPTDPTAGIYYQFRGEGGTGYKVFAISEGISADEATTGSCNTPSIKQKAGEYCSPANRQHFQVSNNVEAANWAEEEIIN